MMFEKILDMTGAELKMVADHMGHNINIHTDVYRLQSSILEKTKVARVLIATENGSISRYQGKNLQEISLEGNNLSFNFLLFIVLCNTSSQNLFLLFQIQYSVCVDMPFVVLILRLVNWIVYKHTCIISYGSGKNIYIASKICISADIAEPVSFEDSWSEGATGTGTGTGETFYIYK